MSIRFKLTTTAIAVIVVANSLFSFIMSQYFSHVWMREVQTRVGRSLNVAQAAYRNHLDFLAALLRGTARDRMLVAALGRKDLPELEAMLRDLSAPRKSPQTLGQGQQRAGASPIRETGSGNVDFVVLVDPLGKVICRSGSGERGDDLSRDPLIARALTERKALSGTVVLSRKRLRTEGPWLAKQALIRIIPNEATQPVTGPLCSEGMVAAVAVPVLGRDGQLLAVLYGGDLLNHRYEMVDAIRQQVFREELYNGKPIGAMSITLGDVRIAANITTEDGARAVGTQLSAPVRERVLEGGHTWSAPALVLNDWYFTAYEPIQDPGGHIIGALCVGLLQAPFVHQCSVINTVFLVLMIGTTLATLVLLVLLTKSAIHPIHHVVSMAQRVIGGDLSARVGIRPAGEMGVLCRAVDSMAQSIQEREEMLNQSTRQQIGRSEHLASVGRLAAGVAHEINNPLTGVLAFADLLREKENMDGQDREDLDLIVRETKRAREIVRGLLEFARETPSRKTLLDVNDLVRRTLQLLGKREAFQNINLVEDLADSLPKVYGDKNQLQQVFVNLSLNACEAMPQGGTLLVSTACAAGRVVIKVVDTGSGIKREHVEKIFEPFFTTKPAGKGTGLGLSVSYGIVQQHGGALEVESQEGKGTTFTVTLPAMPAAETLDLRAR